MSEEKGSGLIAQRQIRLEKVKKLRDMGIDPYPAKANKTHSANEVVEGYDKLEGTEVVLAGRLMSWREHGPLVFGHIQDQSGRVQLYIKKEVINETDVKKQTLGFEDLTLVDVGDFVEAKGEVTKTERGEISILVKDLRLLTKAIRPLPDKHEGLKEKEAIFRRRYLDLVMNSDSAALFQRKAKFWKANRDFMAEKGFIEVETPVLEHVTGGADARPFETHHNDLDENLYLRISTELYQKRLIAGGFEKIYTIGPNFRNEGLSDEHLQEFYQIEWYWAYADYRDNMELVKEMFRYIANSVYGTTKFETRGHKFDLADEWIEVDYVEIIKERFGIDIFTSSDEEMLEVIKKEGIKLPGDKNRNRLIDNLWKAIRKTISGPGFLVNEPKFMSPLAKSKTDNPDLTERFHVLIGGSELGNGYSELNDPIDQIERFREQQSARESGDDEAQMMDIDFVEMLEYGMPVTSGYAHSERLFWYLENVTAREGTLFPLLKFELEETTKELYKEFEKYMIPSTKNKKGTKTTSLKKSQEGQDFSQRMVIVVNKDLEGWKLENTVAHIAGLLGSRVGRENFVTDEEFKLSDGSINRNSQYPIIIMEAKAGQFADLLSKVQESGLDYLAYTNEMIETTDDSELVETYSKKTKADLDIKGIGVFGDNDTVKALTKKFSLKK